MDRGGNLRRGDLYSVYTNNFKEIERYKNHKWDTFLSYEELPIKDHYKFGEIKAKYVSRRGLESETANYTVDIFTSSLPNYIANHPTVCYNKLYKLCKHNKEVPLCT